MKERLSPKPLLSLRSGLPWAQPVSLSVIVRSGMALEGKKVFWVDKNNKVIDTVSIGGGADYNDRKAT